MNALNHPNELNYFDVYRQARRVMRHTSRAHNADWYRQPQELGRQWHIWLDGVEVVSAIFCAKSGKWFVGPAPILPARSGTGLPAEYSPDELRSLHETLHDILKGKNTEGKANSLGVVLHVADEFGLAELAPEYGVDEEFDTIRSLLASDPWEAMGNQNLDLQANSWRLLPYWGVVDGERRSVAVQMGLQYGQFIARLKEYGEQRNIPVVVTGVSAPLEALRLAPIFLDGQHSGGHGQVLVYIYRAFTVLSLFTDRGGLLMVRCLPHRKGQDFPSGLGEALVNSSAAHNMDKPQVTIVPMREFDVEPLSKDLAAYFSSRAPMDIGLVHRKEISCLDGVPEHRVELGFRDPMIAEMLGTKEGFAASETFRQLDAGWATQNFYMDSELESSIYPSRSDLRMLRFFGLAKWFLAMALFGFGSLTGLEYIQTSNESYWSLDGPKARAAEIKVNDLESEKDRIERWENMMAKRSEGWLAMELLLGLFTPDSGLVVDDCSYAAEAEAADKAEQMSFQRIWTIKGFARDEGMAELARLGSRTYMEEKFAAIADEFGVDSLRSDTHTRRLVVNMQQKKGQMPAGERYPTAVARFYRNAFELKVIQSFDAEDSLALNLRPPQKS